MGELLLIPKLDHDKCAQAPMYCVMNEWKSLSVEIRNARTKSACGLKSRFGNLYMKVLCRLHFTTSHVTCTFTYLTMPGVLYFTCTKCPSHNDLK